MENHNEKNLIMLISPLNTIYTYNFEFISKFENIKFFTELFDNNKKDIKLEILPYIEENVFKKNIDEKIIQYFYYYARDEKEKNIIMKEHNYLNLNKYYIPKFILKEELLNLKNKYIIFISYNYEEDFLPIENFGNIIRILNWMLYKKTNEYIKHQEKTLKYIEYNNNSKTNNCELIIECLRQCNILIKYCYDNICNIDKPNNFRKYLIDNFISNSIKCLNILDHNSTAKLYRKREFAQSSGLVYYIPFLHHFLNLKNEKDFDKYYKDVKVIIQRNPYFYFSNREIYNNFQNIFDKKNYLVQLHHISIIDKLFNRYLVYEILFNFVNEIKNTSDELNFNLKVPFSIEYKIDENSNNSQNLIILKKILSEKKKELDYPIMIKPINCEYHKMNLILNEEGLSEIFLDENKYKEFILKYKEFIIQKYINHDGEMIKAFCINGKSYEFIRPSIPNLSKNKSENFSTKEEFELTNEMIYQSEKNKIFGEKKIESSNFDKILQDKFNIINKIILLFLEKTYITLFGLDFLYDKINDTFYILEINYFPSYRELGNKINYEMDNHIIKFYNKFKLE